MIERTVSAAERGQRLDKYIKRVLPGAGTSFLYKMLRKKNITCNHARADGSEILQEGDVITFWFSDETYAKFSAADVDSGCQIYRDAFSGLSRRYPDLRIIYEQSELVFVCKPAGVLSQKARENDLSLNEWFIGYLVDKGQLPGSGHWPYVPSVCNRLDRNTGGIVICARTLLGSHAASEILRDRSVHKYYQMIVTGRLEGSGTISCWTRKDPRTNVVNAFDHEEAGASRTLTKYRVLQYNKERDLSLIEAELITGKTHQLRVHLRHIGHPILGDPKYGDPGRQMKGVHSQLLWSQRLELPVFHEPELADLSGKTVICEPPQIYRDIMR